MTVCSCCQYVTPWGCISVNRCSPFLKPRIDVSFDGRCGLSIADQCPSRARKPNGFGLAVGRNDKSINNGLSGPILGLYADMLEPIRAPRGGQISANFLVAAGLKWWAGVRANAGIMQPSRLGHCFVRKCNVFFCVENLYKS